MAGTEPLTGVTVQDQDDAATGGTQIGNLAKSIAEFTTPPFANNTARDAAYTAKVSAGGFTMRAGLLCSVAGVIQEYSGTAWTPLRPRIITRNHTPVGNIPAAGFRESGVADGPSISSFTTYLAGPVLVVATFRIGVAVLNTGYAPFQVKIDGTTVADGVARMTDEPKTIHGTATLSAGTHTISVRAEAVGGEVTWASARVTIHEGAAE